MTTGIDWTSLPDELIISELVGRHLLRDLSAVTALAQANKRLYGLVARGVHSLRMPFDKGDGFLSYFRFVRCLALGGNARVSDASVAPLTQLTTLYLGANEIISDAGVAPLTRLTTLHLGWNKIISDASVAPLTRLMTLHLGENKIISKVLLAEINQRRTRHLTAAPQ
jgi:hypothetical protein